MPEGCHVDIETSAIDMLERLSRLSKEDMLVYEYVSLRDGHGDDLVLRQDLAEHERAGRTSEQWTRMWRDMPLR